MLHANPSQILFILDIQDHVNTSLPALARVGSAPVRLDQLALQPIEVGEVVPEEEVIRVEGPAVVVETGDLEVAVQTQHVVTALLPRIRRPCSISKKIRKRNSLR